MCFAHVIKGQQQNMPLLQALLQQRITLIDYEPLADSEGYNKPGEISVARGGRLNGRIFVFLFVKPARRPPPLCEQGCFIREKKEID